MPDLTHVPPLVEINPRIRFLSGPAEVWRSARRHRHLIANFVQRDFALKYRNSALGYVWSLLQPMLLSAVYFLMFVIIAGEPEARAPMWIFVGVIVWTFFSRVMNDGVTCLTRSEGMIKQVYFPREIFAITSAASQFVIAGISLVVVIPMMMYYRLLPTPYLLLVPAGFLLAALLALGVGLGAACLNVVNRDVEQGFKFFTRAGLFLSPIMWTFEKIPQSREGLRDYLMLNPVAVPITMVRKGFDGQPLGVAPGWVVYSVAFCVLSFLVGTMVFKRFEADVVKKI